MILRKGPEALSDFSRLTSKFPQNPHLQEAYYYKAFVYEDIMYDIAAAKIAYNDFINRFPTHKLVTDATLSIKYLGQSPEEIVASFQQNDSSNIEE
jgi:outer membrane protein assembly factor BamD (BamD/ComL family)